MLGCTPPCDINNPGSLPRSHGGVGGLCGYLKSPSRSSPPATPRHPATKRKHHGQHHHAPSRTPLFHSSSLLLPWLESPSSTKPPPPLSTSSSIASLSSPASCIGVDDDDEAAAPARLPSPTCVRTSSGNDHARMACSIRSKARWRRSKQEKLFRATASQGGRRGGGRPKRSVWGWPHNKDRRCAHRVDVKERRNLVGR